MTGGFLLGLAWRSAWNRRFTLALTVCSIALSTFMLLGVERVRTDLRSSFSSAVSGTDLIVGARTGSTQLLLYAVFHVGAATNNIRWSSVEALQRLRGVAWWCRCRWATRTGDLRCWARLRPISSISAMASSSRWRCAKAGALTISTMW